MGRQDHVLEPLKRRGERTVVPGRLFRKHVQAGASEVSAPERLGEGADIDDEAAGQIQKESALFHHAKLALAEELVVVCAAIDVDSDDVGPLQEILERTAFSRVSKREPFDDVVVIDIETHGFRKNGELGADIAVSHDPELLAADLERARRTLSVKA